MSNTSLQSCDLVDVAGTSARVELWSMARGRYRWLVSGKLDDHGEPIRAETDYAPVAGEDLEERHRKELAALLVRFEAAVEVDRLESKRLATPSA